jgi:hypothetical protein
MVPKICPGSNYPMAGGPRDAELAEAPFQIPVPDSYDGGRQMWIQAGLMDDSLDTDFKLHIFCGSRADWDRESPNAKHYNESPD